MIATEFETSPPEFSKPELRVIASVHWGLAGAFELLDSERDQNVKITAPAGDFVLKVSNSGENRGQIELQNAVLNHIESVDPSLGVQRVVPAADGSEIVEIQSNAGPCNVRALTYLHGSMLAASQKTPRLMRNLGSFLGRLSRAMRGFGDARAHRPDFLWNLDNAASCTGLAEAIVECDVRELCHAFFDRYNSDVAAALKTLRLATLHQDANDYNVVICESDPVAVAGLIDFGDMVFGRQINELAVAMAYGLLDCADFASCARPMVAGYTSEFPLEDEELQVLLDLVRARLFMSICISSDRAREFPDNEYLRISQEPAMRLVQALDEVDADVAVGLFREAAGLAKISTATNSPGEAERRGDVSANEQVARLRQRRDRHIGPSLSVSYQEPLHIVRGQGAYLYDSSGREYLDCVNNVAHVGHCHPLVVDALARQASRLNTNTRYLHGAILDYAERISATMPDPLSVLYFVCSGTEANELAMRIARTHAGCRETIVVDWAYHGNSGGMIDISPCKFRRAGGLGKPDHVEVAELPDPYRGRFKGRSTVTGERYGESVRECIANIRHRTGHGPAAFVAESISGCGGQVIYPEGYLKAAFAAVREAGGVCVIDEVQCGFGRVGSHYWAFESQGVVPDIVVLGKPMGNGHPIAAVVTTPHLASSFANGMEYFNSFGGNPVSAKVGMAVMDAIEQDQLQQNAHVTGAYLLQKLAGLKHDFDIIGDVRGCGLFLGIELVGDRDTRAPAGEEAMQVANRLRDSGVLISTDGPFDNVLKVKPPLCFGRNEADQLCEGLVEALQRI